MLSLILGLEKSFAKSFLYILYVAAGMTFLCSAVWLVLVDAPLMLCKAVSRFAPAKVSE